MRKNIFERPVKPVVALFLIGMMPVCHAYMFFQSGIKSNFLIEDGRVLFCQSDDSLTVLALESGEVLRRDKTRDYSGDIMSTPAGILVSDYNNVAILNRTNYNVTWQTDFSYDVNVVSNRLISSDGNGLIQCRNLKDGTILWTYDLPGALQIVAVAGVVVVHRAATYEQTTVPMNVALNLETGKELFHKIPPPNVHWERFFFDGTNIYMEKGSFKEKRADFELEDILIWNVRGEEIGTIALSPELRKSLRFEDAPYDLDQKTFWQGRIYPDHRSIPAGWKGKLVATRKLTNNLSEVSESEFDLDDGVFFVERAKSVLGQRREDSATGSEIEVRTPSGHWTGVLPYLSQRGSITAVANGNGKILIGTDVGEVECVDAVTGASQWLYIFPTIHETLSYSSHGMPPMMSQAAAIFRNENRNPPKSGLQLANGSSRQTRILLDPDPVDPFRKLPLYLTIVWGGVGIPLLCLFLIHMRPRAKKREFLGAIYAVIILIPLLCFLFFGRVSPSSSISLRAVIIVCVMLGTIDAFLCLRQGRRIGAVILFGMMGAIATVIFPYLFRI